MPRLYLMTPPLDDAATFAPTLSRACRRRRRRVLLRLADGDERTQINRIKAIAPLVQDHAALLVDGHRTCARSGADGAHMSGIDAFSASALRP